MNSKTFEQFNTMDSQALATVEGGDGDYISGPLYREVYYLDDPPINHWILDRYL